MSAPPFSSSPASPTVLTRAELDKIVCSHCGKTGQSGCLGATIFRAPCHPNAGLRAWYTATTGHVTFACAECGAAGAKVQVAWAVPS